MTGEEARAMVAWRMASRIAMDNRYVEHYKCARDACPSEAVVYTPEPDHLEWRPSRYHNRGDELDIEGAGPNIREYVGASWRCMETRSSINVIMQPSERERCEMCRRLFQGERPEGVPEHGEVVG